MNTTYCPACLKPLVGTLSCTCSNVYDRIRARVSPETRQRVKDQMIDLMNAAPIYIGVDPAFRKDGFWIAVVDMSDRTVAYQKMTDVLDFHDWLRSQDAPIMPFVCVENSNLQNKSFDTSGNRAETARKGRNVGTNQAVSELAYISALRAFGEKNVYQVSPKEKGAKWTEAQSGYVLKSERLTVITKGENQDCRDALKLALIAAKRALWNGAFKMMPK